MDNIIDAKDKFEERKLQTYVQRAQRVMNMEDSLEKTLIFESCLQGWLEAGNGRIEQEGE